MMGIEKNWSGGNPENNPQEKIKESTLMSFSEFVESRITEQSKTDSIAWTKKEREQEYDRYIANSYEKARIRQDEINELYKLYVQDFYINGGEGVNNKDNNPVPFEKFEQKVLKEGQK